MLTGSKGGTSSSHKVRILIIHRYFWPENLAVLPLMLRDVVAKHVDMGHQVQVVCGTSTDNSVKWAAEFGDAVSIDWFRADIDRNLSAGGRILNCIKLVLYGLKAILFGGKRDLVYVVSYPPFHAGLMIFFSSLFARSKRHLYYVQDNHTYMIKNKYLRSFYVSYTNYVVKKCTRVITLSEPMKQQLLAGLSVIDKNIVASNIDVIENYSTDLDAERYEDVKGAESEKLFDIIYAGNHGSAQNLYYFLELVSSIELERRPSIKFFGNGTEKSGLIRYAEKLGVSVEFNDAISREEISKRIGQARLGLVAAQPGLMNFAFPSKLAAYNSAGTKALVMCENESALKKWLFDNDIGFTLDPESTNMGALQLEQLLSSDSLIYSPSLMVDRSRELYSKESYIGKIESCIKNLLSSGNNTTNNP